MAMECSVEDCSKPSWARGFCSAHYQRWYRETFPEKVAKRTPKRKEYERRYYREHREEFKERLAKQQAADPEGFKQRKRETTRKWREANPERARENARRGHARRKYGLTLEEYEAILAKGCAICRTHEGRLCMDHDHANGKVRAALCKDCNVGLGSLGDDPERLRAAADYIEEHRKT